ncbi:MAG: DUF2277 domain-containing protein [Proteobacteria bacterium]|jgi:hypothetical protein|nr:DUF2277 domain-containing protein [Pseudomonadota bacterium]MDA1300537.1 DUF2277 domain-containing protein [Pseudomonadota bacterium]
MCRNIRTLYNFDPPATGEDIQAAALQFIRKVSGTSKPSRANDAAFNQAVEDVADIVTELLASMVTSAPPKSREQEKIKAQARSAGRFGR